MSQVARVEITEKDITGLKYFDQLAPLLERLHDDACRRDAAGNRILHYDQCGMLILDAIYFAPHKPLGTDETVIEHPDRKPGPGMLVRAARDPQRDLSRSRMIGDRLSDVLAGIHANCHSIRVANGYTYGQHMELRRDEHLIITTVSEATEHILRASPAKTS
jgi:histidinol phosphatase-like enzyme